MKCAIFLEPYLQCMCCANTFMLLGYNCLQLWLSSLCGSLFPFLEWCITNVLYPLSKRKHKTVNTFNYKETNHAQMFIIYSVLSYTVLSSGTYGASEIFVLTKYCNVKFLSELIMEAMPCKSNPMGR